MLISFNWLNSYFDGKLSSAEDVAESLITRSYEIDGLEKKGDDYVIDIDVLPNRGSDSLSHNGVAKELGVILDMEPSIPSAKIKRAKNSNDFSVQIDAPDGLVRRVNKALIDGVSVKDSPNWLKEKLEAFGQQPINNIVDATNYIMLETGQPIHAFDYDKLSGKQKVMIIRFAKDGEDLELLDGTVVKLDNECLVWGDSTRALDLAGIKGGADSGVNEKTKNIVLSACSFDPVQIRKTRQRTRVVTDASKRFEQDLSSELTWLGIGRAIELILEIAGGECSGVIDIYPNKETRSGASVDVTSINSILGTALSETDIELILNKFKHAGFEWSKKGSTYTMLAPFERKDINLKHDVIEEIGRMYGYNNIESSLPGSLGFTPQVSRNFYGASVLKKLLVSNGYSEVYNYIMGEHGEVELANSLVEGMNFLRSSMIDSIFRNLEQNIKYAELLGLEQIKIFEINKVFNKGGEHWALGIGVKNARGFKGKTEMETVREATSLVDKELGVKDNWNREEITIRTQYDLDGSGVIAELDMEKAIKDIPLPDSYDGLIERSSGEKKFKPISQYPFVLRDISVWMPIGVSEDRVCKIIQKSGGDLLVRATPFDKFEQDGRTSYAFHLVFQSPNKTLFDKDINVFIEKMSETIAKHSGEVR